MIDSNTASFWNGERWVEIAGALLDRIEDHVDVGDIGIEKGGFVRVSNGPLKNYNGYYDNHPGYYSCDIFHMRDVISIKKESARQLLGEGSSMYCDIILSITNGKEIKLSTSQDLLDDEYEKLVKLFITYKNN